MQDDVNKAAPYSFATSDPRQAMHSKDARPDAHNRQVQATGTAIVPIGPVVDASAQATRSLIRQHKFGTVFLAGVMGFAIGAALGR